MSEVAEEIGLDVEDMDDVIEASADGDVSWSGGPAGVCGEAGVVGVVVDGDVD